MFTTILLAIIAVYATLELGTFVYLLCSPSARNQVFTRLRHLLGNGHTESQLRALHEAVAKVSRRTKFIRKHQKKEAGIDREVGYRF